MNVTKIACILYNQGNLKYEYENDHEVKIR